MTTYTTSLRLWKGVPLDLSIKGAWGPPLNTNDDLLEAAILGTAVVSVAGLSTLTLSTANGAADQARNLVQQYTGALTGDCTILLPNVQKFGFARNSTTGSRNIILNAGAGTTAIIPPDGSWHYYWTDGATNVTLPLAVFGPAPVAGPIVGTTGTFSDLITPNSVKGIKGTTTNDNAQAGSVGEPGSTSSGLVALTNNIGTNLITQSLGAGDWDVQASALFGPPGPTVVLYGAVGVSQVSATLSGLGSYAQTPGSSAAGVAFVVTGPVVRVSVGSPTNIFVVAQSGFSVSTMSAVGALSWRRVR